MFVRPSESLVWVLEGGRGIFKERQDNLVKYKVIFEGEGRLSAEMFF